MNIHHASLLSVVIVLACQIQAVAQQSESLPPYQPPSVALHREIVRMDSLLFDAYNHCRLEVIEEIFSEDIEFFHDQGGLSTSRKDLVQAIRNNICGKVQRQLIAGTIEVYPIAGYGAVQMGWHQFHNRQDTSARPHPSKFVMVWKKDGNQWQITRVISLH